MLPMSGLSEVGGIVSDTIFRKKVNERRTVTSVEKKTEKRTRKPTVCAYQPSRAGPSAPLRACELSCSMGRTLSTCVIDLSVSDFGPRPDDHFPSYFLFLKRNSPIV